MERPEPEKMGRKWPLERERQDRGYTQQDPEQGRVGAADRGPNRGAERTIDEDQPYDGEDQGEERQCAHFVRGHTAPQTHVQHAGDDREGEQLLDRPRTTPGPSAPRAAAAAGAIVALRNDLPEFIPLSLLLLLPLSAIIFLLLSIYPRFSNTPDYPFFFRRSVGPDEFGDPPEDNREQLILFRNRCVSLATILYRKVLFFRIALGICLFYAAVLLALAIGDAVHGFPVAGRSS